MLSSAKENMRLFQGQGHQTLEWRLQAGTLLHSEEWERKLAQREQVSSLAHRLAYLKTSKDGLYILLLRSASL